MPASAPPLPASAELQGREVRLESLRLLTGRMAHDFNNYLMPILGYLTLLREEISPESTAQQYLNTLEQSVRRAEGDLNQILLAVRPQRRFRPQWLEFHELVHRTLDAWSRTLPGTPTITVRQELDACRLFVDVTQWEVALQQLLSNVQFALQAGGHLAVHLQTEPLPPDRAAELGLSSTSVVHLSLQDDGIGMAPATQGRAFDPFFTTRVRERARGLGLTIVHGIARLHGGQVALRSQENAGTIVDIWLPLGKPVTESGMSPIPLPSSSTSELQTKGPFPPQPANRTVLVVDDDTLVLQLVQRCLQYQQIQVLIATSAEEAFQLYRRQRDTIDLVLSDVVMPGLDGVEFARRIWRLNPEARIILMSGDEEATSEERLATLHPHTVPLLKKPFALDHLLALIQQAMAR